MIILSEYKYDWTKRWKNNISQIAYSKQQNCNVHTTNFYCNTTKMNCRHWEYTNDKTRKAKLVSLWAYITQWKDNCNSHFPRCSGTIFLYILNTRNTSKLLYDTNSETVITSYPPSTIYVYAAHSLTSWWNTTLRIANSVVWSRTNLALLPARQLDHYWSAVLALAQGPGTS
jgi:hypothetical protein